jgi:dephospho-CoA kinase
VILVGLTGGIGSGKSTVSALLAERGAVILDADAIVRELQKPGSPVLAQMAEAFGPEVLTEGGELDRAAVAAIAFKDPDVLARLNKIVHPAVGKEMNQRILDQVPTTNVVVLDIPLLTENPREGLQGRIVIDVPVETQVERLVSSRGFDEDDARARITKQATREQRLAAADFVVDNSADLAALEPQIDRLWEWLQSLPQLPPDYEPITPKPKAPDADAGDDAVAAPDAEATATMSPDAQSEAPDA